MNKTPSSKAEEEAKHAPEAFPDKRWTEDQKKDPRKEFEAGLMGAVSSLCQHVLNRDWKAV